MKNMKEKVHQAMDQHLQKSGHVAPVDVLMDLGILSKKDYEDWRFGRVIFLEKVCRANLSKLSDIMKEIRSYAATNHLIPSWSAYQQWGKAKHQPLRFSKSNDPSIERHYATHFVDVTRVAQLKSGLVDPPTE